jgi:hypothetical protein
MTQKFVESATFGGSSEKLLSSGKTIQVNFSKKPKTNLKRENC